MSLAVVGRIIDIDPHPNADRLDILRLEFPIGYESLVTGKHYRVGDLGIWLQPGAWIPGQLAYELWMVGKQRASEPFEVREIEIRGVASPGLWCGRWYRNDSSKESRLRADELARGGGQVVDGWIKWARWNDAWRPGDIVDAELGIGSSPSSSGVEQPVSNRTVTVGSLPASGASPVAGSN